MPLHSQRGLGPRECAVEDILAERERQGSLSISDKADEDNSRNDWVGFIVAYAGRAVDKCHRNKRENQQFEDNLIKVGALVLAALEAHKKGHC